MVDTLPNGVSYDPGSAYIGSNTSGYSNYSTTGLTQAEPSISADGKTLTWVYTPTAGNHTNLRVIFRTAISRELLLTTQQHHRNNAVADQQCQNPHRWH